MRELSYFQASRCEAAEHPTCRCRCHGALHGIKRNTLADGTGFDPPPPLRRDFFESLPEDDPHHLSTDEEKRARRKARRMNGSAKAAV